MKYYTPIIAIALCACGGQEEAEEITTDKPTINTEKINYPETRKDTSVVDDYFGTKVADPYRWLEDDNSDETKAWVKEQVKTTNAYLEKIPQRAAIKSRLDEVWTYASQSSPYKDGGHYLFYTNDGVQNQSVLHIMNSLDDEPKVFIDPNKFSDDGTVSLNGVDLSKDGKYAAYRTSEAGSDWQTIHIMDVESGELLEDEIQWAKFTGTSWQGDGFYYSSYGTPEEGEELSGKNEYHKVYYHKIGTPQSEDKIIYEDKEHPLRNFYVGTTRDERFVRVQGNETTSGGSFWVRDTEKGMDSDWIEIDADFDKDYNIIDAIDGKLLVKTNNNAPMNRVVLIDPENPAQENWKDIIPESEHLLRSASVVNGKLVANYLQDVTSHIYIYDLEGNKEKEVELPGLGISHLGGDEEEPIAFYSFTNYINPPTSYKYNMETGESELYFKPDVPFNTNEYESKQVFYKSKDGTKVPMMITHKKGVEMDGSNPVMLYAYGGFNASITPGFRASNIPFLESGGIYAVPNLRGGGEYGEAWHEAGTKLKKQNVFDDYIGAAEFLIKENYTKAGQIAIYGRSNGGLLIGATMTQRQDLWGACLPAVGVLDMLRFHKFTIGWAWTGDYGSSDNEDEFKALYAYSPLHNVKEMCYPPTMVMTADHDDRVVPAHSFKFAATLQDKNNCNNPMLIRIEVDAGHGAGKPKSKQIEEATDFWGFVFYNLGMEMNNVK